MPPKRDQGEDPARMAGFEPDALSAAIAESKSTIKPVSELEKAKEARLQEKEKRMATQAYMKKGESSNAPMLPPPPPVDMELVSMLLDRISSYRDRFPHLKSRNKCSAKSTPMDLEDELHYFELQLGSSKESGTVGSMFLCGTMWGLETSTKYWNPLNLNLQGLGSVTKANYAEFEPLVDELMIKYGAGMYMPPEYRLILSLGALVVTVHSANTGDATVGAALKKMNAAVNVPTGSADL
jgi:hypothetical protein